MATLTYWVAACNDDADCYSIIGKTRKSVLEQLEQVSSPERYEAPVKKEIFYRDAFDLFSWVSSEGGSRS
jgi:hypothetical protein